MNPTNYTPIVTREQHEMEMVDLFIGLLFLFFIYENRGYLYEGVYQFILPTLQVLSGCL